MSSLQRRVEPYALTNGREGWYVASFDPERDVCATSAWTASSARPSPTRASSPARRSIRLPRSTAGCAPARSRPHASARVLVPPSAHAGRARRGGSSRSARDGSVVVELSFAGTDWLVREILKEAGDAAVLEPPDAREAVRAAVARLRDGARRRPASSRASARR